jgi:hypothetical protein
MEAGNNAINAPLLRLSLACRVQRFRMVELSTYSRKPENRGRYELLHNKRAILTMVCQGWICQHDNWGLQLPRHSGRKTIIRVQIDEQRWPNTLELSHLMAHDVDKYPNVPQQTVAITQVIKYSRR